MSTGRRWKLLEYEINAWTVNLNGKTIQVDSETDHALDALAYILNGQTSICTEKEEILHSDLIKMRKL